MTDIDDRLLQKAAQLDREISPERDLWPGIARAMHTPQRAGWAPMFAQAAAVVLLVGASSAITYVAVREPQPQVAQVSPALVFERASFGSNHELGDEFIDARNALVAEMDVELEKLVPTARAEVEANLELIQEAIYEINLALEQEPDNTLLQQRLLSAYREELTLLRRVSGLTRDIMMRNDI
ncbi:MAG: hypothetical protein HKN64_01495 [Woeseiaceae bacterium]|nr:hypothetical protein [Woeseiaceae bacterium]